MGCCCRPNLPRWQHAVCEADVVSINIRGILEGGVSERSHLLLSRQLLASGSQESCSMRYGQGRDAINSPPCRRVKTTPGNHWSMLPLLHYHRPFHSDSAGSLQHDVPYRSNSEKSSDSKSVQPCIYYLTALAQLLSCLAKLKENRSPSPSRCPLPMLM